MSLGHGYSTAKDGLVLHLDAANIKSYPGSGTAWSDIAVPSRVGTAINGPIYSSNNSGYISFDGVDDTVDCGPVPAIGSSLTGLTIETLVYPTIATTKLILENGTNYTTNTFYLALENGSQLTFEIYGATWNAAWVPYQINTWQHIVGVWQAGQQVKLYRNAVDPGLVYGGSPQTNVINGNTNFFIGSRAGISNQFAGRIPLVRAYSRALSTSEIQQNFEALRGRYGI